MAHSTSHRIITPLAVMLWILADLTMASNGPQQIWTYDFVNHQSDAQIVRELATDFHAVSCGQVSKPAIYEHAGILGDELVEVAYLNVPIPSKAKGVEKITLDFCTGIQDGDDFNTEPGVDGCRFIVHINDKQVFSAKQNRQEWIEHRINLMRYAGKDVKISFLIDPLRSSSVDQAAWGQPRIYVTGQGTYLDDLAILHGQKKPAPKPIETPTQAFPHPRITRIIKDDKSVIMVAVLDETLDLDTRLLVGGHDKDDPANPPAPRLVAGQGNDKENHTLVRILSEYGIPEMQFLAYPAYVRGGVQVEAGRDHLGYLCIVTAPLNDAQVCHLRIFNEHGGFVRNLQVGPELSAPFVMNVGQYDLDRPGEEIAIVSRNQKAGCPVNILFYGIDGAFISHRQIATKTDSQVVMTTLNGPDTDTLYLYLQHDQTVSLLESMDGPLRTISLEGMDPKASVYGSQFEPDALIVTDNNPNSTAVTIIDHNNEQVAGNFLHEENLFWMAWDLQYKKYFGILENSESLKHLYRPTVASTGGVGQIRSFMGDHHAFDLAVIGTGQHQPGLIKSLRADGSMETTVYTVPFAHHVDVKRLSTHGVHSNQAKDYRIGPLKDPEPGTVIEVTLKAKTDSDGQMTFGIYQGRTLLQKLRQVFSPPLDWKYYRFIFRVQVPADNLTLRIQADAKIQIEDFAATRQSEQAAPPQAGSITFDVLE